MLNQILKIKINSYLSGNNQTYLLCKFHNKEVQVYHTIHWIINNHHSQWIKFQWIRLIKCSLDNTTLIEFKIRIDNNDNNIKECQDSTRNNSNNRIQEPNNNKSVILTWIWIKKWICILQWTSDQILIWIPIYPWIQTFTKINYPLRWYHRILQCRNLEHILILLITWIDLFLKHKPYKEIN